MVYKSLHGLAPNYLSSNFERRETTYNLRDSENKLNVPLLRTNYYKNSFNSYSGTIPWNSLPCNLREAESLRQYKHSNEMSEAWHSWKAASLFLITFNYSCCNKHLGIEYIY